MPRHPFACAIVQALVPVALLVAACTPAATPSPTVAPPKPAPTAAATAKPAATTAPTAKPAATTAPAAKPAATSAPAAKPAATTAPPARAAAFDEKAVADFYRGKTIRILVSSGPGAAFDVYARMLARYVPKYLPGNPTIVVENKPGAGGVLMTNLVYNSEAKDGTIIAMPNEYNVVAQLLDAPGVQFDSGKLQWLASVDKPGNGCAVRNDTGIKSIQDLIGGKQVNVGATAPFSSTFDPPAVMNVALGTRFKLVPGYDGVAKVRLAVESGELDGFCLSSDYWFSQGRDLITGDKPLLKVIVTLGPETDPLLKEVPVATTLARTDEAKLLLDAVHLPTRMSRPFAVAAEVPRDRVAALRASMASAFVDPGFLAEVKQANRIIEPNTGEEVTQIVQRILSTPPAIVAKLKEVLK